MSPRARTHLVLRVSLSPRHRRAIRKESLVPQLYQVVPARREDPGRLERVPGAVDAGPRVVRLELAVRPRRLEVPEKQLALTVARRDELAVRRERNPAGVARIQMALERPFPLLFDPFPRGVRDNRVIHALAAPELLRRMLPDNRNGVHVRLTYVFRRYGYAILPNKDLFVVSRRDKRLPIINERDRVARRQVVVIDQRGLLLPQIPLEDFARGRVARSSN